MSGQRASEIITPNSGAYRKVGTSARGSPRPERHHEQAQAQPVTQEAHQTGIAQLRHAGQDRARMQSDGGVGHAGEQAFQAGRQ